MKIDVLPERSVPLLRLPVTAAFPNKSPHCLFLQVRFVQNVSAWREMKPAFYHGHVAYLDFSK